MTTVLADEERHWLTQGGPFFFFVQTDVEKCISCHVGASFVAL